MALLKVSKATVYRLIEQGKLSPVKIGRSVRFTEHHVHDFIHSLNKPSATPDDL